MTVVTIRCHECDTVKPKENIEMRGDGTNICDECRTSDKVTQVEDGTDEGDTSDSEEESEEESQEPESESEEEVEEDETSKFTEQDALSW